MRYRNLLVILLLTASRLLAKNEAGLIVKGLDTIRMPREYGFDFVTAQKCTTASSSDQSCVIHLLCIWGGSSNAYNFGSMASFAHVGLGFSLGKLNLDSVKAAPADSILQRQGGYTMDSIPPNALASRIGNVYVMKTGTDPRKGNPIYAKIKILKFVVHDSLTHSIDMVFLWAANRSGYPDLQTAIDTFHFDSIPVANAPSVPTRIRPGVSRSPSQALLRVSRGGLVVSAGGRGGVWDLRGRSVGMAEQRRAKHDVQ